MLNHIQLLAIAQSFGGFRSNGYTVAVNGDIFARFTFLIDPYQSAKTFRSVADHHDHQTGMYDAYTSCGYVYTVEVEIRKTEFLRIY